MVQNRISDDKPRELFGVTHRVSDEFGKHIVKNAASWERRLLRAAIKMSLDKGKVASLWNKGRAAAIDTRALDSKYEKLIEFARRGFVPDGKKVPWLSSAESRMRFIKGLESRRAQEVADLSRRRAVEASSSIADHARRMGVDAAGYSTELGRNISREVAGRRAYQAARDAAAMDGTSLAGVLSYMRRNSPGDYLFRGKEALLPGELESYGASGGFTFWSHNPAVSARWSAGSGDGGLGTLYYSRIPKRMRGEIYRRFNPHTSNTELEDILRDNALARAGKWKRPFTAPSGREFDYEVVLQPDEARRLMRKGDRMRLMLRDDAALFDRDVPVLHGLQSPSAADSSNLSRYIVIPESRYEAIRRAVTADTGIVGADGKVAIPVFRNRQVAGKPERSMFIGRRGDVAFGKKAQEGFDNLTESDARRIVEKQAQAVDLNKWPDDFRKWQKEHDDEKVWQARKAVIDNLKNRGKWGLLTSKGKYLSANDEVDDEKNLDDVLIRDGSAAERTRRASCHELAAALLAKLRKNRINAHRLFFDKDRYNSVAMGHSTVFFEDDSGRWHRATSGMGARKKSRMGDFDSLEDAVDQYIAVEKANRQTTDDERVDVYDTTDLPFRDRMPWPEYKALARTGKRFYHQG